MLSENRRKENDREDQIRRITQEKVLEANLASEEKIENRRFLRKLQQEEQERQTNEAIIKVDILYCKMCTFVFIMIYLVSTSTSGLLLFVSVVNVYLT